MQISDLKSGSLYRPKSGCKWVHHPRLNIENFISIAKLDEKYKNHINVRPVAMYLGVSKLLKKLPNGSRKAHIFLAAGKKIILNNYSIRNLEKLDEPQF